MQFPTISEICLKSVGELSVAEMCQKTISHSLSLSPFQRRYNFAGCSLSPDAKFLLIVHDSRKVSKEGATKITPVWQISACGTALVDIEEGSYICNENSTKACHTVLLSS